MHEPYSGMTGPPLTVDVRLMILVINTNYLPVVCLVRYCACGFAILAYFLAARIILLHRELLKRQCPAGPGIIDRVFRERRLSGCA